MHQEDPPGGGNGNPLQDSCLENLTDREAWRATVHGVAKSRTRLRDFTFTFKVTFKCAGLSDVCFLHAGSFNHFAAQVCVLRG